MKNKYKTHQIKNSVFIFEDEENVTKKKISVIPQSFDENF
jgi:hypothetical protein